MYNSLNNKGDRIETLPNRRTSVRMDVSQSDKSLLKFYFTLFLISFSLILFLISLISADPTSIISPTENKTIDSKQINVSDFVLEVSSIDAIKWEQIGNSFTPILNDTQYTIVKDGKTGTIINKTLKPLTNVSFKVNKLKEVSCKNSFWLSECYTYEWDFSKFELKNNIVNKTIKEHYPSIPECFFQTFPNIFKINECKGKLDYYIITYEGLIKDLDPLLVYTYSSTASGFFNGTEASANGLRLSAPVLFMDFNSPAEYTGLKPTYQNGNGFTYVRDNSVYNNFATLTGVNGSNTEWWVNGNGSLSNALQFDGIDDYVNMSASTISNTTTGTISAWINSKNAAGLQTVFSLARTDSSSYYLFMRLSSNKIVIMENDGTNTNTLTGNTTISNNLWYHVIILSNGTNYSMYVNGNKENLTISSGANDGAWVQDAILAPKSILSIGVLRRATPIQYFNGTIDEVMYFNRSLTDAEILDLYRNQTINQNNLDTDASLTSYYRLNESSGLTTADSKGGNTGNLVNYNPTDPFWNATGGYDGSGAYQFDGVDDYINIPDTNFPSGTSSRTISAWVKTSSRKNYNVIVSYGTAASTQTFWMGMESNGDAIVTQYGSGVTATGSNVSNGRWNLFTTTYNGSSYTIYINGIANKTGTMTTSTVLTGRGMIGWYYSGSAGYQFNGSIDNVMVLPRALAASEVLALYNGTLNNSNYISKYGAMGDYKSLVFYNSTPTYWNTTLSIADTASARTGIVTTNNEINLTNPNLVSYWALDGNANDAKGVNNGTPVNGVNNATGLSSGAMWFDGVDDYIQNSSAVQTNSVYAISMWFKSQNTITASSAYQNLISLKTGGAGVYFDVALGISTGSCANERLLLDHNGTGRNCYNLSDISSDWHHFMANWNGTTYDLYLDNSKLSITKGTAAFSQLLTNMNEVLVGGAGVGGYTLNGSIDEVAIYNSSLTTNQISQLYKSGLSQHATTNITLQTRTANTYNITDPSLIGLWALNNGTGETSTLFKDELGINNGTCSGTGCPTLNPNGTVGNALFFNGSRILSIANSQINRGNAINRNGTVSIWINPTSFSVNNGFFGFGGQCGASANSPQIALYLDTSGRPTLGRLRYSAGCSYVGANTGYSNTAVGLNQWSHITYIFNSGGNQMYINGNEVSTTNYATVTYLDDILNVASLASYIGFSYPNANAYFRGTLDEVRIYNRSLSDTEILDLYQLGTTHISWSDWTNESLVTDNVPITSETSGNFLQFKTNLYTNESSQSPYIINYSVGAVDAPISPDTSYPIFSNQWDNNATLINSGLGLFNITIENTNGTAWLVINNTNITATNLTTSVYNASYSFTSNGTYPYVWYAYGNGTSHLFNYSSTYYYTVNATPPDTVYPQFSNMEFNYTNGTQYLLGRVYSANATILNTNGSVGIEFNGVNYTTTNISSIFQSILGQLGAGVYPYYWWAYGNGTSNLFNVSEVSYYTIEKADGDLTFYLNGLFQNITHLYPYPINASAYSVQEILILRNNVDITAQNGEIVNVGANFYNYTAYALANDNYTQKSLELFANISNVPLAWLNCRNLTSYVGNSFSMYILATGTIPIDSYNLNDTTNFNVGYTTGNIINNTFLNMITSYNLVLTANNTDGDLINCDFRIDIVSIPVSVGGTKVCSYCKLGYYNLKLPWIRESDCVCSNKLNYGYQHYDK